MLRSSFGLCVIVLLTVDLFQSVKSDDRWEYDCTNVFDIDDTSSYEHLSPTLTIVALEFPSYPADNNWKVVAFNKMGKKEVLIPNVSDATNYFHRVRMIMGDKGDVYVIHNDKDNEHYYIFNAQINVRKTQYPNLYDVGINNTKQDNLAPGRVMSKDSGLLKSVWQVVGIGNGLFFNISTCEIFNSHDKSKSFVSDCHTLCGNYKGQENDHCIYDSYKKKFYAYNGLTLEVHQHDPYVISNCIAYHFYDEDDGASAVLLRPSSHTISRKTMQGFCLQSKAHKRYYHVMIYDSTWVASNQAGCRNTAEFINQIMTGYPETTTISTTTTTIETVPTMDSLFTMEQPAGYSAGISSLNGNLAIMAPLTLLSWALFYWTPHYNY